MTKRDNFWTRRDDFWNVLIGIQCAIMSYLIILTKISSKLHKYMLLSSFAMLLIWRYGRKTIRLNQCLGEPIIVKYAPIQDLPGGFVIVRYVIWFSIKSFDYRPPAKRRGSSPPGRNHPHKMRESALWMKPDDIHRISLILGPWGHPEVAQRALVWGPYFVSSPDPIVMPFSPVPLVGALEHEPSKNLYAKSRTFLFRWSRPWIFQC